MFYCHLACFLKPPLGGRPNTKLALQILTTIDLLYVIMCEDPTLIEFHWNNNWLRAWSFTSSHHTWGPVTTLHDFGSVLRWPLDTSFWLSQVHGRGSWLVCEVALSMQSLLLYQYHLAQCCILSLHTSNRLANVVCVSYVCRYALETPAGANGVTFFIV